jgi:hypothetical protein
MEKVKVLTTLPETKAASMVIPMPIVIMDQVEEQVTEAAGDLTVEALAPEEKKQKCNEFGTVVVQITVNRSGNVIAAKYTKGTTNKSCLVEPALATARKYRWQPDSNLKHR